MLRVHMWVRCSPSVTHPRVSSCSAIHVPVLVPAAPPLSHLGHFTPTPSRSPRSYFVFLRPSPTCAAEQVKWNCGGFSMNICILQAGNTSSGRHRKVWPLMDICNWLQLQITEQVKGREACYWSVARITPIWDAYMTKDTKTVSEFRVCTPFVFWKSLEGPSLRRTHPHPPSQ